MVLFTNNQVPVILVLQTKYSNKSLKHPNQSSYEHIPSSTHLVKKQELYHNFAQDQYVWTSKSGLQNTLYMLCNLGHFSQELYMTSQSFL